MEIIKGKIKKAKKVVIYGPEGIGKSTFASRFPDPLFIDTEGSTNDMDVARLPRPTSWTMLMEEVRYVLQDPSVCRTLVIDTADWAEQLCADHVCAKHNKSGIEDFGYGKGYVFLQEEFGRLLNLLTDLADQKNIHVVLTAHAKMRKFEQPEELGAYDRWEMKLTKNVSPMVKEWADMLLFCNYKAHTVAVDDKGKKKKALSGKRVMYTAHHPCWDAKNRYGLPEECEFDYGVIAGILEESAAGAPQKPEEKPAQPAQDDFMEIPEGAAEQMEFDTSPSPGKPEEKPPHTGSGKPVPKDSVFHVDERIPKALRDLMEEKLVSEEEIQQVVADRGYYPRSTPILNYDPDFVSGVLVGAWGQVYGMIEKLRASYEIPFEEDKK
jgi:hypothetical protein